MSKNPERKFKVIFAGVGHVAEYTEQEVLAFFRQKIGSRLSFEGRVVTIDDFQIYELVPRKLSFKMEII